ncbi:MAG: hypothetical protein HN712_06195 [Gemmatimonadetes bacterium]|jgi:hypothetical protein|nr:hypothetical protein [Gemmatimonadota bacterium]MBT6147987.1 hypothetical protein [Gemmatimonadota bacterium]MBT7859883.1 hypothetical protein [Gemmatimonadota bacterium]
MWLGLSAVATALAFALVKFFTTMHMRRLRERQMRLTSDIKRERSRFRALEGKLQVETARRGSVEQKLGTTRRFKDELFSRLRVELPEGMQAELRHCIDRHPIPEPAGVRVAHQLGLAEKINEALGLLSILVIETPNDSADDVLEGIGNALNVAELRFSGPTTEDEEARFLTTAFDRPDEAIAFIRNVLGVFDEANLTGVRAILLAGLNVTEFDQESVNKLFARSLHGARAVLDSAPEEGLLVEGKAYDQATDRDGLQLHSHGENLWHLQWSELNRPEEATTEAAASDTVTDAEAGPGADPDDAESPEVESK